MSGCCLRQGWKRPADLLDRSLGCDLVNLKSIGHRRTFPGSENSIACISSRCYNGANPGTGGSITVKTGESFGPTALRRADQSKKECAFHPKRFNLLFEVQKIMKWLRALLKEAGAMWILMLVFIVGALNAAGWLQYGQTLSHMTVNLTRLGFSFAGRDGDTLALFLVCLLSFFMGATLSGYGFPEHRVGLWRRSGVVLMISGALLMLAEVLPLSPGVRVAALPRHPDTHNAYDRPPDRLRRGAGTHDPRAIPPRGESAPVSVSFALPVVFPVRRSDDRAIGKLA